MPLLPALCGGPKSLLPTTRSFCCQPFSAVALSPQGVGLCSRLSPCFPVLLAAQGTPAVCPLPLLGQVPVACPSPSLQPPPSPSLL